MALIQLDIGEVAELGTQVAIHGAISAAEIASDALFDLIVGIVILVYEIAPNG
jgi:hypothetical protein